jgi:hypothetical protein
VHVWWAALSITYDTILAQFYYILSNTQGSRSERSSQRRGEEYIPEAVAQNGRQHNRLRKDDELGSAAIFGGMLKRELPKDLELSSCQVGAPNQDKGCSLDRQNEHVGYPSVYDTVVPQVRYGLLHRVVGGPQDPKDPTNHSARKEDQISRKVKRKMKKERKRQRIDEACGPHYGPPVLSMRGRSRKEKGWEDGEDRERESALYQWTIRE